MSKVKKILLGVLLTVLTLGVIGNSFLWYIYLTTYPRGTEINVMEDTYVKIDDVMYIRADMASFDPQKIEDGTAHYYNIDEILPELDKAVERREAKKAANVTED